MGELVAGGQAHPSGVKLPMGRAGGRRSRKRMQRHYYERLVCPLRRITARADAARNSKSQQRLGHFIFRDEFGGELFQ